MNNILIIQLTRLGDIVQSIPLVFDLRAEYPDARIYLLINEVFQESEYLLNSVAAISNRHWIAPLPSSPQKINLIPVCLEQFVTTTGEGYTFENNAYFTTLIQDINQTGFDIVINLNNSPIAKHILKHISCENKVGFGTEASKEWTSFVMSFIKTRRYGSINLVDIFRKFGMRNAKCEMNPVAARSNHHIPEHNTKIALQCGARNVKRQFHLSHYIEIVEHYLAKGYEIYLLGIQSESEIAEKIVRQFSHNPQIKNLIAQTDLKALVSILSHCERLYTPDTGTMHLAALCGTPITALFYGPAYPYETLAYGTTDDIVYMPDPQTFQCYPCADDEPCPYDFHCHHFSFKKALNGDENEHFVRLQIHRDEIGQILYPVETQIAMSKNIEAILWRAFTKYYFYAIKDTPMIDISQDLQSIIQRELKLFKMIDTVNLETAQKNFTFLRPLIYYKLLSNDEKLIKKAIDFFNDAICGFK